MPIVTHRTESGVVKRARLRGESEGSATISPAPLGLDVPQRIAAIDERALHEYRLERVRAELRRLDYAGVLLADPMNIRYATGTRNMAVWTMHAPGRYAFVATEGPVVLFEFASSRHVSAGAKLVDERRPSTPWFYFLAGPRTAEKAGIWADEVVSLVRQHGGGNRRLAIDRCEPMGTQRLLAGGIERIRAALRPGLTENQLWSLLHETNIAHDGEWIECRLLASGGRTNPWFQECGNRVIDAGDLVCFDTDMVGPCGYLADVSRSYVCPGRKPSDAQHRLYALAQAQILHNMSLLRAGLTFREFSEKCWNVPDAFVANRYMMMVHGVGLVDEYPSIAYVEDYPAWGYDGVFAENMVVSVESYIGERGGAEGVKLEQQVLVTADGAKPFSKTSIEDALE